MLIPFGVLSAAGAGGGVAGDYELISTEILGSDQSSVTFSSLATYASTYKHLQIRLAARTNRSGSTGDVLFLRLNGDSGANYARHALQANGSTVISFAGTSANEMALDRLGSADQAANVFGSIVIDLLDTYSTTKNKTVRGLGGVATSIVQLSSGVYLSTSSTTSATLLPGVGTNFVAGSRFSLYGIRGEAIA